MIRIHPDKWLNFEALSIGGKVFVHRWTELFHRLTLDSYRVRHLNVRIAIQELLGVINDFEIRGADSVNVRDAASEALHLLKEDPIAHTILPNYSLYLGALSQPLTDNKHIGVGLRTLVEQILNTLNGHYRGRLLRDLYTAIEGDDINLVVRLTDVLAADLINEGYDFRHLYWRGEHLLNSSSRTFKDKLEEFLGRFRTRSVEKHSAFFRLVFRNETDAKDCPCVIGEVQLSNEIPLSSQDAESAKFSKPLNIWRYAACSVTALDPFSASRIGAVVLSKALDLFQFSRPNVRLELFPSLLVWSPGGKPQLLPVAQELLGPIRLAKGTLSDGILEILEGKDFKEDYTRHKVILGLQFLRRGLGDLVPHGQFLNLWIGLEAIAGGKVRTDVAVVRKCMAQTVALGHPMRIISDLRDNLDRLKVEWHSAIDIRKTGKTITDQSLWEAVRDPLSRENLLEATRPYPLLQHRLKSIAETFTNPEDIKRSLEHHAMDVEWHIQRMYRIRNAIVHGGVIPEDLTHLVSHLATYLWTTLRFILDEFEDANGVRDIQDFFARTHWLYNRQLTNLDEAKGKEPPYPFLLRPKSMLPRG